MKNDTEGFAFSDGAISTGEPRMLRSDFPKIFTVRDDLVIAAGGGALQSEALLLKVSGLPCDVEFSDALGFLRAEVQEHNRKRVPWRPGGDISENLGVGLLGHDPGKGMRAESTRESRRGRPRFLLRKKDAGIEG